MKKSLLERQQIIRFVYSSFCISLGIIFHSLPANADCSFANPSPGTWDQAYSSDTTLDSVTKGTPGKVTLTCTDTTSTVGITGVTHRINGSDNTPTSYTATLTNNNSQSQIYTSPASPGTFLNVGNATVPLTINLAVTYSPHLPVGNYSSSVTLQALP